MIRVRASVSLGELSESRRAKASETRQEKACRYCFKLWRPLSGMAEKSRNYCYSDECASAHEEQRNAQRRARYLMRVPRR